MKTLGHTSVTGVHCTLHLHMRRSSWKMFKGKLLCNIDGSVVTWVSVFTWGSGPFGPATPNCSSSTRSTSASASGSGTHDGSGSGCAGIPTGSTLFFWKDFFTAFHLLWKNAQILLFFLTVGLAFSFVAGEIFMPPWSFPFSEMVLLMSAFRCTSLFCVDSVVTWGLGPLGPATHNCSASTRSTWSFGWGPGTHDGSGTGCAEMPVGSTLFFWKGFFTVFHVLRKNAEVLLLFCVLIILSLKICCNSEGVFEKSSLQGIPGAKML